MSASTFSYAQAAKGQLAAHATTSQQTPSQSQTSSLAGNPTRDTNTNASTRDPSVAVSTSSNDIDSRSARSTSANPEVSRPNGVVVNQDEANTTVSVAGSISSSKAGTEPLSSDSVAKGTEARGRPINTGLDAGEYSEGKKSRKPKKGKSAEKDGETEQEPEKETSPPKIELSEAPLPSVNVWVQRQQAAKVKAVDQPTTSGVIPAQTSADSKTRPSQSETAESSRTSFSGKQGSRRDGETSRNNSNQGQKRSGPRGARGQEREPETNLLANNPASWPTPETAAVNLKVQPQGQPEKEEKEDAGTAKPRQKKEWVQLTNFVPTVKFETALPNRGPRGGRVGGSRGGRDTTASHHAATNSTDRVQDTNTTPRTNPGSKRAPVEGSGGREGRKTIPHTEHPRLPKESPSDNANGDHPKPNQTGAVNGTNYDQPGGPNSAQPFEGNAKASDPHKDIRTQSNRDTHPPASNGANHRSGERSRGSGRGRGGFNQNNPNGISHYNQNIYPNQHQAFQFQPNGSRHIPHYGPGYQSMPYSYPGQSGPNQRKSTNSNRRQGSGRVPTMAPMNVPYDPNLYPNPTSGMYPYDSGNLLQLAQTQVEYYFSVENCVKDWFLRTHMDSQGFVPVSFITQFNRMRELLVDHNILRQACIDSLVLEIVIGNDGVERVRSKEGWEKWVIPDKSMRDPSARHDGPSTWQQFNNGFQHSMMPPHYPVEAPPVFSPTSEHGFTPYTNGNYTMPPLNSSTMNGVNGHNRPHESQLSAAVPEFSPSTTSAFNGIKSASQNGSEDAKPLVDMEPNGLTTSHEQSHPTVNGATHDQLKTNGVHPTHQIEGH